MTSYDMLKDKVILAVDDEPDVLEVLKEHLDDCLVHTATDRETALQLLQSYTYDIVILDIMGVDGFGLLEYCVARGLPTVMLTAQAITPEALKKAIQLGAVSFLPKEEISRITSHLQDVVMAEGKPVWRKVFERLEEFFSQHFGSDWEDKDRFLKEFMEELKRTS
ncbi:MAG: response regulator [Desulfobacteraceae bacterium]